MLAGRRDAGAKLLQKALDRRHAAAIKQYAKAKDEEMLRRMWDESMRSSDIPGAYWALLSHAVATETIVKKAFQDVHMLSHLSAPPIGQTFAACGSLSRRTARSPRSCIASSSSCETASCRVTRPSGSSTSCWPATTQSKDRVRMPKAARTARRPAKKKRPGT
jgi:hypothetical protein